MAGPGLDRTGILTPRQARGFCNPEPACLGPMGGHMATKTFGGSTTPTVLYRSELITPDVLGLGFNFNLDLAGVFGGQNTGTMKFDIDAVEPDGTRTELATITSATIPDEDDKFWCAQIFGRVALEQAGAVDGKLWVGSLITLRLGTPLYYSALSALAGVAVTFVNQTNADLSGVMLEVTITFSANDATNTISLVSALLQTCNVPGASGQGTAP